MLKHISQLASMAEYKKACSGDGKVMSDKPTPFVFFPKFAFSKQSSGPVLLLGNVPGPVLSEAKKKGGTCITGKAAIKDGKVELEGTSSKVSPSAMNAALASVGVSKKVATTGAEDDEEGGTQSAPKTKFPDPLKAPPKAPEALKSKPLSESYKDEDKKMGWRAQGREHLVETDQVTTKYFSDQEVQQSAIGFDEKGRMVDSSGNKIRGKSVGFVGDASAEGQLRQFELGQNSTDYLGRKKFTHHSSPVKGGAVTGAGQITTKRSGKLEEITDQSGHYKPGSDLTFQTVKKMGEAKDSEGFEKNLVDRAKGADGPINKPAKVTLVGKQGFSAEEWESVKGDPQKIRALAKQKFGDSVSFDDAELGRNTLQSINMRLSEKTQISVTTQQFLQTEGNETQIRAKKKLTEELETKGKKTRDALDAPAPAEPAPHKSGMSAQDFKKLGGNPATLKEATKGAKPSVRLSEKSAQKLASDAVAKDNSSRAGKKLGPQSGIGGERQKEQARSESTGDQEAQPDSPRQVRSLGYVGEDEPEALSSSRGSEDPYSKFQPSKGRAPASPLRQSVGEDGYVLEATPAVQKPTDDGYSIPSLSNKNPSPKAKSPLRSSTKRDGYSTPATGNTNKSVGYVTPVIGDEAAESESESGPESPLRSNTASDGYSEPVITPKKGGYAAFKPGKTKK